jgi:hypothetical protein
VRHELSAEEARLTYSLFAHLGGLEDDDGPALGQEFRGPSDRTVLPVGPHTPQPATQRRLPLVRILNLIGRRGRRVPPDATLGAARARRFITGTCPGPRPPRHWGQPLKHGWKEKP